MTVLRDMSIGVSVSNPPDLARLGFPTREIERALLSVCTSLVRAGATVVYGGDLRPGGFTSKMFRHLAGLYAKEEATPFVHVIMGPTLKTSSFESLHAALRERSGSAATIASLGDTMLPLWLDGEGFRLGPFAVGRQSDLDNVTADIAAPTPAQMSRARAAISGMVQGSIAIGGKMGLKKLPSDGYSGAMPGVVEEAILTLQADKPFVPLGAYGGATRDMAIGLGLLPERDRVPRGEQAETYHEAMATIERLANRIPAPLRDKLAEAAGSDQAERAARLATSILAEWSRVQSSGVPSRAL